jgi:hypothetical protein
MICFCSISETLYRIDKVHFMKTQIFVVTARANACLATKNALGLILAKKMPKNLNVTFIHNMPLDSSEVKILTIYCI